MYYIILVRFEIYNTNFENLLQQSSQVKHEILLQKLYLVVIILK